jgi:hypothetical protein
MRQAPDGGQSGGRQPTEISVLNRRVVLAPALPMNKMHGADHEHINTWLPTLDIGSHIND